MINFLVSIPLINDLEFSIDFFQQKPNEFKTLEVGDKIVLLWGDPIITNHAKKILGETCSVDSVLQKVAGHYYYLFFEKTKKQLILGNSYFGILPVYYTERNEKLVIASKVDLLIDKNSVFNERFVLENILFNYPLFNTTYLKEVKLLPTNSGLQIYKGKWQIINYLHVESLFIDNPISTRKSLNAIVETFLESTDKYYPESNYYASLTGGFDGRTLVAKGLTKGNNLITYSFGSADSQDVLVAKKLAQASGLEFKHFKLDSKYIQHDSLENGLEFIQNSGGTAGFARAHYQFATKKIAKNSNILITGNFGSEVFRAAHIAGAVISTNLYHLFSSSSIDEAFVKIENSNEANWLNKSMYREAKESLFEDLKSFPAFSNDYTGLTKNQLFYKVVFDEVFRKYFGAEMVNQFQVLKNRTPFLDIDFLKAILQSKVAGVHTDFFTHNPLKRFKGQIVYANVLKRTNKTYYSMKTDKGYSPSDVLSLYGKTRIAQSFLNKKLNKHKISDVDPYSVHKSFEHNKDYWGKLDLDFNYFSPEIFKQQNNHSNSYSIALSQAWWYNQIKSKL